jgi:hypothetical protein
MTSVSSSSSNLSQGFESLLIEFLPGGTIAPALVFPISFEFFDGTRLRILNWFPGQGVANDSGNLLPLRNPLRHLGVVELPMPPDESVIGMMPQLHIEKGLVSQVGPHETAPRVDVNWIITPERISEV